MSLQNSSHENHFPKGAEAPQLVLTLPRINKELSTLGFTIYTPREGKEERRKKSAAHSIEDEAKADLEHDPKGNEIETILVCDLPERLNHIISSLPNHRALGINSRCNLRDGSVRHIPMIDFKLTPSCDSLKSITQDLKRIGQNLKEIGLEQIGQRGVILETGASYHFYGFDLLKKKHWIKFMGSCLLFSSSDSRWIGHSLLLGNAVLRISASMLKQTVPFYGRSCCKKHNEMCGLRSDTYQQEIR
jgi:hypothetical protein